MPIRRTSPLVARHEQALKRGNRAQQADAEGLDVPFPVLGDGTSAIVDGFDSADSTDKFEHLRR